MSKKRLASEEPTRGDEDVEVLPFSPPSKRPRTDQTEDKGSPSPVASSSTDTTPRTTEAVLEVLGLSAGKLIDGGIQVEAAGNAISTDPSGSSSPRSPSLSRKSSTIASSSTLGHSQSHGAVARAGSREVHPMSITSLITPSPPAIQPRNLPSQNAPGLPTTPQGDGSPSPMSASRGSKPLHVSPPVESVRDDPAAREIARLKKELESKNAILQKHSDTFNSLQAALQCQICYELMYDPYM